MIAEENVVRRRVPSKFYHVLCTLLVGRGYGQVLSGSGCRSRLTLDSSFNASEGPIDVGYIQEHFIEG